MNTFDRLKKHIIKTAVVLAPLFGVVVPVTLSVTSQDAKSQTCGASGCGAFINQQEVTLNGASTKGLLGAALLSGGGSAAAVLDHCVKSFHLLVGGQGNSNFNTPEQKECLSVKLVDTFIISAMGGNDEKTKYVALELLKLRFPKAGDITDSLVSKYTECVTKNGVLKNDWLAMMSPNAAVFCDFTAIGRENAQRAHELAVARASAPQITNTPPLSAPAPVVAACTTPQPAASFSPKGRETTICLKRDPKSTACPQKCIEFGKAIILGQ